MLPSELQCQWGWGHQIISNLAEVYGSWVILKMTLRVSHAHPTHTRKSLPLGSQFLIRLKRDLLKWILRIFLRHILSVPVRKMSAWKLSVCWAYVERCFDSCPNNQVTGPVGSRSQIDWDFDLLTNFETRRQNNSFLRGESRGHKRNTPHHMPGFMGLFTGEVWFHPIFMKNLLGFLGCNAALRSVSTSSRRDTTGV